LIVKTSTGQLNLARAFGLPILYPTAIVARTGSVAGREATRTPSLPRERREVLPDQTPDVREPPPGIGARRRWHTMLRELGFVGTAALLYSLVRGLTDDRVDLALTNAQRLISFERGLSIFVEPRIQNWAVGSDVIVNLANAVYIMYWPIIIGALLWLLARRPAAYSFYRNALLGSGGFSLAVFALFPLAPPRFMPEYGFVDTIAARSDGYRDFNASALVNEYAAMPSLHFGWVLLAGIAIYRLADHRVARAVAVALPVLMLSAIVLTGNHYLMDAVVGGAVVLGGLGVSHLLAARQLSVCGSGGAAPDPWPASRPSTRRRGRG
jgi:hypothetical protein